MQYEINDKIVLVPIGELRENPEQRQVHPDFDAGGRDAWLVEDVRLNGIGLPLIITPAKMILDGHRRWAAAKIAGTTHVLCIVFAGDPRKFFASAQLGKVQTVFAKCMLYRPVIEQLVERGKASRIEALKVGADKGKHDTGAQDRAWGQLEQVLGVERETLLRGMRVFTEIDRLRKTNRPDDNDSAKRLVTTFRNQGAAPALRLMNAPPDAAAEADEREPDPATWETTGRAPAQTHAAGDNTKRGRASRKPSKVLPVPKSRGVATEKWQANCFKALATLETTLKERERWDTNTKRAADTIEKAIKGKTT